MLELLLALFGNILVALLQGAATALAAYLMV